MAMEIVRVRGMDYGSQLRELDRPHIKASSPNSERFSFMNQSVIESNWKPQSWLGRFWRDYVAIPFEMKVRQLVVIDERREISNGK